MNEYIYSGNFAGKKLFFSFRHPDSAIYLGRFIKNDKVSDKEPVIRVPVSDCDCWIKDYGMGDDGNTESGMSVYRASDALLPYNRVIIHAAAILWRGKAYLFSADSGTGKSTQIRLWKQLYGDGVRIINGDKPVLRLEEDGSFTVHPSPWKGKEEWGDDNLSAPLGGIILLKQGSENTIDRLSPHHAAARLLPQFFSSFETKETLSLICKMEEKILLSVPVWFLVNKGDEASASLTHETLLMEEENQDVL